MSHPVIIIVTVPTEDISEKISRDIVEKNLAAGIQISNVKSIYKWDGQINERIEYVLNIKTMNHHFNAIEKIIDDLHPYEVPPIEQIKIEKGKDSYLKWVEDNTKL